MGFQCLDETWYDGPWFAWWISDEVTVILRDPQRRVVTISRIFGEVDTNETRTFGPRENCLVAVRDVQNDWRWAPRESWTCGETGAAGPFSFSVEMYEADSDDWNMLYDCFTNPGCPFGVLLHGSYPESSSYWTQGDERIGRKTLSFRAEELAAAMPTVNDTVEETVLLGPCHDERGCVVSPFLPTGPEYAFSYRLTRLPDRTMEPVLDPDP